jgi:hypothetical protein
MCPVIRVTPVLLVALFLLSCSSMPPASGRAPIIDGQYDSEFPSTPVSSYLERIGEAVQRINAIAYYRTYFFTPQERFRDADINGAVIQAHDRDAVYSNSSTSGTGVVLVSTSHKIALLTCSHIVSFPETLLTFFPGPDRRPSEFVASVSILKRTALYVATLPEGGTIEVLVMDRGMDLAVVGHSYESSQPHLPPVFAYPLGSSEQLQWGTFVYLFGFPAGNKVVTRGIVSSPNKDRRHAFIVDAVFGRGFSGGICLALRDGVPNFELVGLIKMVPARTSYVLTPGHQKEADEIDLDFPYTGPIYVERRTEIEYGVTQAISAESLKDFLESHEVDLSQMGYSFDRRFLGDN